MSVDATKTSPGQGRECVTVATIPQGATVQYTCSMPITGRYVTVYLPVGILQLCEVQVFGMKITNQAQFSNTWLTLLNIFLSLAPVILKHLVLENVFQDAQKMNSVPS